MTTNKTFDAALVRELTLYATNDSALYHAYFVPVCKALARKRVAGSYDAVKAAKAFRNTTPAIIASYDRAFSTGDGSIRVTSADRDALAEALRLEYEEYVDFLTTLFERIARYRRVWTKAAIRQAVMQTGSHHFDRDTMRFFGETMANYSVEITDDAEIILHRSGGRAGYKRYVFDPETHELRDAPRRAEGC